MGTWRFSLEPLLDRSRLQEAHEREIYDRMLVELRAAESALVVLERSFCSNAAAVRGGELDSRALRLHYERSDRIVGQIEDLRRRVHACEEFVSVGLQNLTQARNVRKTLETLKSRQCERRRQAEARFEERELDEVNAARMRAARRT